MGCHAAPVLRQRLRFSPCPVAPAQGADSLPRCALVSVASIRRHKGGTFSGRTLEARILPEGRRPLGHVSSRRRRSRTPAVADGGGKAITAQPGGGVAGSVDPETIAELRGYLERELPRLFGAEGMQIEGRFEDVVEFEDPITRYDSLGGYLFNIAMLKALFSPVFLLHSVYQTGPAELTSRWTMKMYFRLLPWQPELVFTGLSIYGINPATGKFRSHKDIWDSVEDNAYLSKEGLMDLITQCSRLYGKPQSLGSPEFDVLLRRSNYEVRRYQGFSAAETAVQNLKENDNGVALGGAGGPAIALRRLEKWAATEETDGVSLGLPNIWEVNGSEAKSPGTEMLVLRKPLTAKTKSAVTSLSPQGGSEVTVVQVPAQAVAVCTFSGAGTAERFAAEETALRAALLKDALEPGMPRGRHIAATYYTPSPLTPHPLLRNEVLLPLEGFQWP